MKVIPDRYTSFSRNNKAFSFFTNFGKRSRLKKLITLQHDLSDCGPACLAAILKHYGKTVPLSVIRLKAGTDKNGTNLLGLSRAAEHFRLSTRALKFDGDHDPGVGYPYIAHTQVKEIWHHFVLVLGKEGDRYTIMDPAKKEIQYLSSEQFFAQWTGILLVLKPEPDFEKDTAGISHRSNLYKIVLTHKRPLFKAIAGAIIYSALGIVTAFYIGYLADTIIPGKDMETLSLFSMILIGIILVRSLAGYLKNLLVIKTGKKIDESLIDNYNHHLIHLPMDFFSSMKTGEILTRINDAVKIRGFINKVIQEVSVNTLIIIITLSAMYSYSWQLGLVTSISLPLYLFLYRYLDTKNKKYLKKAMEQSADMESALVETIRGIDTIKAYGIEEKHSQGLQYRCHSLLSTIFKSSREFINTSGLSEIISSVWIVLLLYAGSRMVILEKISYGDLFSVYSLYAYISAPLVSLVLSNRGIRDARIAAERLFQVMDLEKESCSTKETIERGQGVEIEIKDLSFSFPGKLSVLDNINIHCKPGEITAIVGESGSGKSTILSLLMGFYGADSGSVFIQGNEFSREQLTKMRSFISWVPQSTFLFSGTLKENIILNADDINESKLNKILLRADLNDTIRNLPSGIETMVREDGNNFSGGEKQKISLARAYWKDAGIFLLDEPSSSMDFQSEKKLIHELSHLKKQNKTIVLVAHTLSVLDIADSIYVLKNGKIIEKGSCHNLLRQDSHFRKIFESNPVPAQLI